MEFLFTAISRVKSVDFGILRRCFRTAVDTDGAYSSSESRTRFLGKQRRLIAIRKFAASVSAAAIAWAPSSRFVQLGPFDRHGIRRFIRGYIQCGTVSGHCSREPGSF